MTALIARQMIGAEFLKLRRKRSTVAWALLLSVGAVVVFFLYNALQYASDSVHHLPAGGVHGFGHALDVLGIFVGPLAAVLIGVEAGAGDLSAGIFRDLAVTGRSRRALFLVRLPGAVAMCMLVTAAAFAVAVVATFALADGSPTPSASVVLQAAGWVALANGVVCVVAVGLASLTGSRSATITALVGWELVASPLLIQTSSLGSVRESFLDAALLNIDPVRTPGAPYIAMSVYALAAVFAIWVAAATALGAWRTATRDA